VSDASVEPAPPGCQGTAGEVRSLKTELGEVHSEVTPTTPALAKVNATLAKITSCLPELNARISGQSGETSTVAVGEQQYVTNEPVVATGGLRADVMAVTG
jgi:hypothetical protein